MDFFTVAILGVCLIISLIMHYKQTQLLVDKIMAGSYKDYKVEQRADIAQQHMIDEQKQAGVIYPMDTEVDKDYL